MAKRPESPTSRYRESDPSARYRTWYHHGREGVTSITYDPEGEMPTVICNSYGSCLRLEPGVLIDFAKRVLAPQMLAGKHVDGEVS